MITLPDKRVIASWAFYDFANTIFSMNVISLYFALWVTVDHGGQDILYSVALSGSMFAVAISVPFFGAISDQTGKRVFPLTILTIISVVATALIGQSSQLLVGLFLFIIANYCYQSALVFYNGMLPDVARQSNVGMISGYGVALGYMGSIAGLLLVRPFVEAGGRSAAFLPTAILFLSFSIPCFFFVKDPNPKPFHIDVGIAFRTLKKTVVVVTHDIGEAGFLGDKLVLLRDGTVVQQGSLHDLVNSTSDPFVKQFINAQRTALQVLGNEA